VDALGRGKEEVLGVSEPSGMAGDAEDSKPKLQKNGVAEKGLQGGSEPIGSQRSGTTRLYSERKGFITGWGPNAKKNLGHGTNNHSSPVDLRGGGMVGNDRRNTLDWKGEGQQNLMRSPDKLMYVKA